MTATTKAAVSANTKARRTKRSSPGDTAPTCDFLEFVRPGRVRVGRAPLPSSPPGHALVRTLTSAVSAGTELLVYRGELPPELALDETLPALAGRTFAYPTRYGYAAVGVVERLGPATATSDRSRELLSAGARVFAFVPHASAFTAPATELLPVPADLEATTAAFFPHAETAVNLVLDAAPLLGERVAVIGQGLVGLLATAALARFPLAALVCVEPETRRRRTAARLGASTCATAAQARARLGPRGADLTLELSGDPRALDGAVGLTGSEGRIVVGSWYGQRRAPIDLGGHFHRGRLQLVSSQVSHIAPRLLGRWDRARRAEEAWRLLAALPAGLLAPRRFPLAHAPRVYAALAAGRLSAPVVFVY
jgi:threonine dehydrogenase-like Zn-dependent dehydrogenase